MRSSTDELQRLAAIFSDPKVEVGAKERELASSLQRAGVDKSLWMPLALGLQEKGSFFALTQACFMRVGKA